ncbi:MAG TPA: DUF6580 family putative transport protein [Thermoanaerobaculia bacterium]|nr:DUF6580 family putative transport protein [Thermoanaerobaculia bacterium]
MNRNTIGRFVLAAALVLLCTVMRVLPHPWNLTPVGATALFSGACFDRRRWAFLAPLAAMFVSDTALQILTGHGYHVLMPVVYATFAIIVLMGIALRSRRGSAGAVAAGAVGAATLFYAVTNFAVWTISAMYPRTLAGLMACYIAGIPFYGTMLIGDLLYSGVLFGTFVWAERTIPRLAAPAR